MVPSEKTNFLFRFVPTDIRKQLKLDDEALFSTTDQVTADKITKDILRYVARTATITDATACIGGSAFSFAQNFSNIIAIEYDKTRFEYLQFNMSILPYNVISNNSASSSNLLSYSHQQPQTYFHSNTYGDTHSHSFDTERVKNNKVECRNGDAIIECTKQFQDVIFIDPPWGGPEYKTLTRVKLYLSGLPLHAVCQKIYQCTHYIVLKVPVNFDEEVFLLETTFFMELIYKNSQLRKMHLLIFRAKHRA